MASSLSRVTRNLRLVGVFTMLSRVLGLARDAAMAARFGNGPLLDAFTLAFRIPNLARALLGEGALATAFLPHFLVTRNEQGRDAAQRLAVAVLMVLVAGLTGLVLLAEFTLWGLGRAFPWPADAERLRHLIMIMTPFVGLICLTTQLSAILHADGKFAVPAVVPIVLNLVWLMGLWLLVPLWESPDAKLTVMAWCVVIAGGGQLLVAAAAVRAAGYRYSPDWRQSWDGVRIIGGHMLPVVGGLMITQINVLLDSLIAWGFAPSVSGPQTIAWLGDVPYPLSPGTASALYFGQRLYQFPLGVFGVALGTVLFPLLAEHAQRGDRAQLRGDFSLGLRLVAAIGIPASAGLMILARPVAAACFQYGAFDARDAAETANMIAAYGSGVWAYCGVLIIHRGFYALNDRITPMRVGLVTVLLNLVLSLSLIWFVAGVGLAASTAIVSMLQCLTVGWLFRRKIGGVNGRSVAVAVGKAMIATTAMMLATGFTLAALEASPGLTGRGLRVLLPVVVAITVYYATAWLIAFREPWDVVRGRSMVEG